MHALKTIRKRITAFAKEIINKPWFDPFIISVIIFNVALLGWQTSESFNQKWGLFAERMDVLFLSIFVVEIGLKITANGFSFFKNGWNWFDFVVVLISLLPNAIGFSMLRAFRILRLLRLISIIPKMRRVIGGFFMAIPGMFGVLGILIIIFYVSAVIATMIFGQNIPVGTNPQDAATVDALFGTLGRSFFSLFQLMTLENWTQGVVLPVLKLFPHALWFFIPFIVLTSFAVLNLFIGIIVDSMQDHSHEEQAARDAEQDAVQQEAEHRTRQFEEEAILRQAEQNQAILQELQSLRAEIQVLKARL